MANVRPPRHTKRKISSAKSEYRLAATDIPIVLTIASEAVSATDTRKGLEKIKELDSRFDHAFLIRSAILYSKEQRI
jgi:hypothetical protein